MVFQSLKRRLRILRNAEINHEKVQYLRRIHHFFQIKAHDEVKSDDIIVVGYLKSGNTWFQNIIAASIYKMNLHEIPLDVVGVLVPDISKPFYHRYTEHSMYFKSHHLPQKNYRKVIYLVRDGRDAMVSYYRYRQGLGENITWQQLLDVGSLYHGKWQDHVAAWQENPYQAEMITIRYEDLLDNTVHELGRFCDFVGVEHDDNSLGEIAEMTRFDSMRKREDKFGFQQYKSEQNFMRKGKKGSFQDEMPPEVLAAFQEQAGEWLERLGYTLADV